MRIFLFLAFAVLFSAPTAAQEACIMNMTFDTPAAQNQWRAVNDGVMGGRSSGGPEFKDGHMIFRGVINTNGGGFSSIRMPLEEGAIGTAKGLSLRVKSDGRAYKITMRTPARYRWRNISFQMELPATTAGEWSDVRVNFQDAAASIFGRPINGATFVPAQAWELGIILADGQDGPFRLDVQHIKACE